MRSLGANLEREQAESSRRIVERFAGVAEQELRGVITQRLAEAAAMLKAAVEREMADTRSALTEELRQAEERLDGRAAADRERLDAEIAARIDAAEVSLTQLPLSRSERRQELRLVRAESSGRVSRALEKLETRGSTLLSELDARYERVAVAGAGEAAERVATALRRVDEAVERIERTGAGLSEVERRARAAEVQAVTAARQAQNAAELEARIRKAMDAEADAAARISEAERRLIALARTN